MNEGISSPLLILLGCMAVCRGLDRRSLDDYRKLCEEREWDEAAPPCHCPRCVGQDSDLAALWPPEALEISISPCILAQRSCCHKEAGEAFATLAFFTLATFNFGLSIGITIKVTPGLNALLTARSLLYLRILNEKKFLFECLDCPCGGCEPSSHGIRVMPMV